MDEKRQWISVKDQLPVNGITVQVFTIAGNLGYGNIQNNYDKSRKYWSGYNYMGNFFCGADQVTHWMPLPSPPELSES